VFSETAHAYIAGYTDAEALIGVYRSKDTWHAEVAFKQTQSVVVEWMQTVYGGSMTMQRPKRGRPLKRLRIQAWADVQRFLRDVLPYLREKRAQAEIVLNEFNSRLDNSALDMALRQLKRTIPSPVTVPQHLAIAARNTDAKPSPCGRSGR